MAVIGNAPFQGLVSGGNILDASIEGVDLSTSAIAARLGYTPVDPGAAVFSANPTISSGTANSVAYLNGSKVVTGSSNLTFNGTTLTVADFTDSSLTAGRVVYAGTGGNLTDSANLTFNGTNLSSTGGATFQGGPTGYGGGEVSLGTTASGQQNGISTQGTGTPQLIFDHRGTSNTGNFLWRNGTAGATNLMYLSGTGNLGIGITPNAWGAGTRALELGSGTALWNPGSSTNTILLTNSYNNGTDYVYKSTASASLYQQAGNEHRWSNAPSGTAGFAITFTQAMTLDASGRLLVGNTSNTGANTKLSVGSGLASSNGVIVAHTANGNYPGLSISNWTGASTTQGPRIHFDNSSVGTWYIGSSDGLNAFDIAATWGTPLVRISSSGNVGIGNTNPGAKLVVSGSGNIVRLGDGTNTFDVRFQGPNNWAQQLDTTNDVMNFQRNSISLVTFTSGGRVGIGTTTPLAPLHIFYGAPTNTTVDDVVRITSKYNAATGASAVAGSGPSIVFSGGIGDNQTRDRARIVAVYEQDNMSGLAFHTQSTADLVEERVRIQRGGNVGIGTTAPLARLDVFAGQSTQLRVRGTSTRSSSSVLSAFQDDTNGGRGVWGSNAYANTSYSTVLSRYQSDHSGWAIIGNNFTSTYAVNDALQFSYVNAAGTTSEYARFNDLGSFGLGITPNRWFSNRRALQLGGSVGAISMQNGYEIGLNFYVAETTAAEKRVQSGYANKVTADAAVGDIVWSTAGTGAADSNITWGEKARITNAGQLLVGTTITTGDVSNTTELYAGRFRTVTGTVSVPHATVTTLLTVPAQMSSWIIAISANTDDANNYSAVVSVNTQYNNATKVTVLVPGGQLTFSMSGYSLRLLQGSGNTIPFTYSAQRIL